MSEIDTSLTEVLEDAFRASLEQLAGPMPAVVNAYRAVVGEPPVADVLPTVNLLVGGAPVKTPVMLDVPVAWPGDGASFAITWPLVPGSLAGLVPQGVDISQWYSTGAIGLPPTDQRRFSLSDAVVVPQPPWRTTPANATDAAAMVLFATLLKLGDASATKKVALAGDVSTPSATLAAWAAAVEFALAGAGFPIPPPAVFGLTVTDVGSIVATSAKVLAK